MAYKVANINDLFRVKSDGAIEFGTSGAGTATYVLTSAGANATPTWTEPTTGTVTSIKLNADSGNTDATAITTSGIFTFTGGTNITTSVSGKTVTINADLSGTVTGSGTGQKVPKWNGTGANKTDLTDGPITFSSTDTTFINTNIIIDQGDGTGGTAAAISRIHTGTADGTDNGGLTLSGAGATSVGRGAWLNLSGNENSGDARMYTGNTANAKLYLIAEGASGSAIRMQTAGLDTLVLDHSRNATFTGTVSGTTFIGDLQGGHTSGTISSGVTGVTQANSTDNTKLATTAFVQNLIETIPAGLVFQGTWDARTAAEGGAAGDEGDPALESGVGTTGHFYIVSNSGSVDLDGITDWVTGDWAVFVEVGATDSWQKIDNSSVLDGSGTGQSVAKWDGSGTSNTLTNGPITFSGGVSTFNIDADSVFKIGDGGTNAVNITAVAGDELYIGANNAYQIRLKTDGDTVFDNGSNVGIGTSSPQVPLQIGTHLATAPTDTGLCVSNRKSIRINDADGSYSFGVYIKQNYSGSSYLILGTRHNGADTDALFVKSGSVGIGTASPAQQLDILYPSYIGKDTVQGLLRLTGQSNTENGAGILSAGVALEFYNKWTGGAAYSMGRISGRGEQGYDGGLQFDVGTNTLPGQNGFTTAMTINADANVGIGQTGPSFKLDVNGTGYFADLLRVDEPVYSYTNSGTKHYTHLATGSLYGSGYSAAIITTNIPGHNTSGNGNMFSFKIVGYAYTMGIIDMTVGMYAGENNYYSAYWSGTCQDNWIGNVYVFTNSAGAVGIQLGEVTDILNCEIAVTDFVQGFGNVNANYSKGWSIAAVTTLPTQNQKTTLNYKTILPDVYEDVIFRDKVSIGATSPSANLTVSGPGAANDPVVAIDVTNSDAFNHGLEIFDANLTDGETVLMAIGKAGSTKNTAIFGYIHDADGGNNNLATIGFWGADNKMTVSAGGNVGIGTGTSTPVQRLEVSGNTYVTGYVQASSALIGLKSGYATLGSNSTTVGIALSRDFLPSSYPDLIVSSSGNTTIGGTSQYSGTGVRSLNIQATSYPVLAFYGGASPGLYTSIFSYYNRTSFSHANSGADWQFNNGTIRASISGSGTFTAAGDVVAYGSPSDKRLKENIKPIESALNKVMKLKGVTFDWKQKEDSILELKEDIGFIAQDVQKVVPELVRENEDGMLSMRHQGVAPILLEAIKELKAEIDELKKCKCNCNK